MLFMHFVSLTTF